MIKTLLAEQPLVVSLMLAVFVGACFYGWLQTGKRSVGLATLAIAALIPLAWVIAAYWQTEREQIRDLIYSTADAIEANDIDAAIHVIGNQQPELIARARAELANYEFTQADVNKIRHIVMIQDSLPPQAEVELSTTVTVSARKGQFSNLRVLRRLSLRFEQQPDGSWVVVDYDHGDILSNRDAFSPTGS